MLHIKNIGIKIAALFLIITSAIPLVAITRVSAETRVDKSSLEFSGGCRSDCSKVESTICNRGDEAMTGTTTYEIWYSATGNPKFGEKKADGTIPALDKDECTSLSFTPTANGNYMFKAYQRPGHPGTGELWSLECILEECSFATPTPTPLPYFGIFVECVDNYSGSYLARFGYKWDGEDEITLDRSTLTPGNTTGTLPTVFAPGRHLFDINVNHLGDEVWTVKIQDTQKTSTASDTYTTKCTPPTSTPTPTPECPETYTCEECQGYMSYDGDCSRSMNAYCRKTYDCGWDEQENWVCVCSTSTPTPTATPTPTPTSTPTNDPTPTPTNRLGKGSSVDKSGPTCENFDIKVWYEATEDGHYVEDVEVKISYYGETRKMKTNKDGRAETTFTYKGEGEIVAEANRDFGTQRKYVEALDCDSGTGGAVLGTNTYTQVLGTSTSTLAETGTFAQDVVRMILGMGAGLTVYVGRKLGIVKRN